MSNSLGFIKVAAISPKMKVANTQYNVDEMVKCAREIDKQGVAIGVFPELGITGYTCGDLFYQELLYKKNLEGLKKLKEVSGVLKVTLIVGTYIRTENNYYNCAAVLQNGKIKGIVPKMFLPNANESYEARWFASGIAISKQKNKMILFEEQVPFGNLIFQDAVNEISFGIEICEDLWVPANPGAILSLAGAHLIFNPSASNEAVGKSQYRKSLVVGESAKSCSGYVVASCGVGESTTDGVFGGECLIAENGIIISEGDCFLRDGNIVYGEIDVERLKFERSHGQNFEECATCFDVRSKYTGVSLDALRMFNAQKYPMMRQYAKNPFVPKEGADLEQHCKEIFKIQTAGLAKRFEHTNAKKLVIGISGGLDSTLALLVCHETMKLLGRPTEDMIAITMPGFGTTGKTYQNALDLMRMLGTQVREIPIKDAVLKHFQDIGHDKEILDTTYENAQARERTQILMDVANKEGGILVGTGDLSEAALGWCTYNGDHMSMYGVNASVPKTLIPFVIHWVMDNAMSSHAEKEMLRQTLQDILDTPITPELLPPSEDGQIVQKTEDTVGPYILHDFFLYYTMRQGLHPKKLLFLAEKAFAGEYESELIKKWLRLFYRRFFSQQFKRSCTPDGPKVGSVSLSPRGDLKMPSDADMTIWLEELEQRDENVY